MPKMTVLAPYNILKKPKQLKEMMKAKGKKNYA